MRLKKHWLQDWWKVSLVKPRGFLLTLYFFTVLLGWIIGVVCGLSFTVK